MTEHVGGPESPAKLAERQARYEKEGSRQFKIVIDETGEAVGWVGYWSREWRSGRAWEMGWFVVPEQQGRGIAATASSQLIELARAEGSRRYMLAYPSVDNGPSNAIARKLGFEQLGQSEFEYPPGHMLRCNEWRLDLGPQTGQ